MKLKQLNLKKKSLLSFENLLGLVLAILIIFEFNFEADIKAAINSPAGMILSLVILVVLFVFLNPIVGLLFLIVIYENVKTTNLLTPQLYTGSQLQKQNILNKLNLANESFKNSKDGVEHSTIQRMAPIIKRVESSKANFVPHINDTIPFNNIN